MELLPVAGRPVAEGELEVAALEGVCVCVCVCVCGWGAWVTGARAHARLHTHTLSATRLAICSS